MCPMGKRTVDIITMYGDEKSKKISTKENPNSEILNGSCTQGTYLIVTGPSDTSTVIITMLEANRRVP